MSIGPHSRSWVENDPAGGDDARIIDDAWARNARDLRERLVTEHQWSVGANDDGAHKAGSAILGLATGNVPGTDYPPHNSVTPQKGLAVGVAGGNEPGRVIRIRSGSELGRALVSADDGAGAVWGDLVKRVKAAPGVSALTIDTGNLDLVGGAGITKDGGAATELDFHNHQLRHRDVNTLTVDGHDFIPWAIPAVVGTAPGLTYQPVGDTAGHILDGGAIRTIANFTTWAVAGRRTPSRCILLAKVGRFIHTVGASSFIDIFLDDGTTELADSRARVPSIANTDYRACMCFAIVTGVTVNPTYRLRVVGAPSDTATVTAVDVQLFLMDLGIA